MTKAAIINDLKAMIGPGIEVDDSGLLVWVNDAYMHLVDEIGKANPDFFTKAATTDLTTDDQEYPLPDDFERAIMVNVKYDATWVRALPLETIGGVPVHARSDSQQGFTAAQPYYYIVGSAIGLMPIPENNVDEGLKLWYAYTPDELSADSDEPAIPAKYHHLIKYGAYANYLDQDDEHVAAENMRRRFDRRVEQMVEAMSANQLDQPRSVQVSGADRDLYYDDYDW